jgi:Protein of unknown function (DUF2971)
MMATDMTLPPLYKYLDVNGAKLTLGNRTFRHAEPSTFKDREDMTVQSIFPEKLETALAKLSDGCIDIILENAGKPPTCNPQQAQKIIEFQNILQKTPGVADAMKGQIKDGSEPGAFDIEGMRTMSEAFVNDTNEFMQTYRILCVTTDKASERMWEDYAQDHEGAVLRIEPNTEKASKFELFRPVIYQAARPALYDQTLDFLKDCWFGDQEIRARAILDKIIYVKTSPYEFEKEYRLAIPVGEGDDWNTLLYHPEEITELYLGLAMTKADKNDIAAKAKSVNPKIAIFQADRDANRQLAFTRV